MSTNKLNALKPDGVIGYLRRVIREKLGDKTENKAEIFASHGRYYVTLPRCDQVKLRRSQIPAYLKTIGG